MIKILTDKRYLELVKKQLREQILFFLKNSYEFFIVVARDGVEFKPQLPDEIVSSFSDDYISFALAGYSFQSAFVEDNYLIFEAGFGEENIGAFVYVEIDRILQLLINEKPLFVNISATYPRFEEGKDSLEVFLSRKKNKKFFSNTKKK
jgi:hypothetical protein